MKGMNYGQWLVEAAGKGQASQVRNILNTRDSSIDYHIDEAFIRAAIFGYLSILYEIVNVYDLNGETKDRAMRFAKMRGHQSCVNFIENLFKN